MGNTAPGPERCDVERRAFGVGAFAAEAGHVGIDEAREARMEGLVVESEPPQSATADVGQEDVGGLRGEQPRELYCF